MASTAFFPPVSEVVKYGLLTALGRKAIFRPGLIWPLGLAVPWAAAPPEASAVEPLVVPPQAANVRAITAAPAAAAAKRRPGGENRRVMVGAFRVGCVADRWGGASGAVRCCRSGADC